MSGLMRGSYVERWQANVAAVGAGIPTADEVREQQGFNPLPALTKQAAPAATDTTALGAADPAMPCGDMGGMD